MEIAKKILSVLPGSQFVSVAITSAVILLFQQWILADMRWKKKLSFKIGLFSIDRERNISEQA